VIKNKTLMLEL